MPKPQNHLVKGADFKDRNPDEITRYVTRDRRVTPMANATEGFLGFRTHLSVRVSRFLFLFRGPP